MTEATVVIITGIMAVVAVVVTGIVVIATAVVVAGVIVMGIGVMIAAAVTVVKLETSVVTGAEGVTLVVDDKTFIAGSGAALTVAIG